MSEIAVNGSASDLPGNHEKKLAKTLFPDSGEQERFHQALRSGRAESPAIVWVKDKPESFAMALRPRLPWLPGVVDRLEVSERAGASQLHADGYFYCLDCSSVFAASPLWSLAKSISNLSLCVDVCASPGGKALCAWASLKPALLVCNETIGKRLSALISNLERCNVAPAMVTRCDSSVLAEGMKSCAQLVVVDAPCSGQSLLAKGIKSPGCFNPIVINTNANRQKRILANSAKIVGGGGYLLYMTCTYSRQENEGVIEWLRKKFPQFFPVAVEVLGAYQSSLADFPAYRLWPQMGEGAGAFVTLLRNENSEPIEQFLPGCLRAMWTRA